MAINGTPPASLSPLAALSPTRTPVNDPGPCTTTTAFRSRRLQPCDSISRRTAGTSLSEDDLPGSTSAETISRPSASATLPSPPAVCINRSRIRHYLPQAPQELHPYWPDAQRSSDARQRQCALRRSPAERPLPSTC